MFFSLLSYTELIIELLALCKSLMIWNVTIGSEFFFPDFVDIALLRVILLNGNFIPALWCFLMKII